MRSPSFYFSYNFIIDKAFDEEKKSNQALIYPRIEDLS